MSLQLVERELKKRLRFPYHWGRMQNDADDGLTRYVYSIENFEDLLAETEQRFGNREDFEDLFNYALNRWYNFHSAKAIESVFKENILVKSHTSTKDKYIDFWLQGIPFDHKTTVFPKGFPCTLAQAQENPLLLIDWLYENQSQQQRKHHKNRLFVVLHQTKGEHWRLKAELQWLGQLIESYLGSFSKEKLYIPTFANGQKEILLADVIWAIQT